MHAKAAHHDGAAATELLADELGESLLAELFRLRVETAVTVEPAVRPQPLGVLAPPLDEQPPPDGLSPPSGLPPTTKSGLAAAVRQRIKAAESGRIEMLTAPELPPGPIENPPDGVGPPAIDEVDARVAEARALLDEVSPGSRTRAVVALAAPGGVGEGVVHGLATPSEDDSAGDQVSMDQDQARRLARYWELGRNPVVCRTLVRMDGDATTQFPTGLAASSKVSYDAVVQAHGTIATAAMQVWPALFGAAGSLVAALIPGGKHGACLAQLWRSPWPWRAANTDVGEVRPLAPRDLVRNSRRFLAWGRVVFESPATGPRASVRSMVHPSGDIETTVLSDATDEVLTTHAAAVAGWIRRMEVSLRGLDGVLCWISAVVALVFAVVGIVRVGTWPTPWSVGHVVATLVVLAVAPLVGWLVRLWLRSWCRRKLTKLIKVRDERIESPPA